MVSKLKKATVVIVTATMLCLCGCNVLSNIESQLTPPETSGEQAEIRSALEAYLESKTTGNVTVSYKLKFPRKGEYRTAFVLQDVDGDGEEEAFVFYTPSGGNTVHIHFLRKQDGVWTTMSDWESESTEVREVAFGDVCGTKERELFVGFETGSPRDGKLMLFSLADATIRSLSSYFYDTLVLEQITGLLKDDFMLLRLGAANTAATVRLFSEREGALCELGSTTLDSRMREFEKIHIGTLSEDGGREVYIDGLCDDGALMTELLYWNGTQLLTPFHSEEGKDAVQTSRTSGLLSMDVNEDGQVEWPQSVRLPAYDALYGSSMWLTEWYSWNGNSQTAKKQLTTIVNAADGYYFTVEDSWTDKMTAMYDSDTRTMTVFVWQTNSTATELLRVRCTNISVEEPEEDESRQQYRWIKQNGEALDIAYSPSSEDLGIDLNMNEILYRLTEISLT